MFFHQNFFENYPLHEKCPYSKLFWSVFSRIPYSVRMPENTDQNNSQYGHFLCRVHFCYKLEVSYPKIDQGNLIQNAS